jgi:protein-disulfide isomerase
VSFFKGSLLFVLALCLGCAAQTSAPDLNRRIERQVRAYFQLPASVQVEVGPRKSSEFPNYETVTLTMSQGTRKQTTDFLISKDGKSLIRMTKLDITKDPYAEIMSKIDLAGRPFRGNKDAKVVIVNYDDFQCPFCSRMHQTLVDTVLKGYGDRVKLVYKDFPLYEIHPWASRAAVDSNCLAQQNNDAYWSFADYVHANGAAISGERGHAVSEQLAAVDKIALEQGQRFKVDAGKLNACIKQQDDSAVRASVAEAGNLGVQATPTIFINGAKIDGALPAEELRATIDRALRDAGEPVPAATAAK